MAKFILAKLVCWIFWLIGRLLYWICWLIGRLLCWTCIAAGKLIVHSLKFGWRCVVPAALLFAAVVFITSVLFHGMPLWGVAAGIGLLTLADRFLGGRL